MRLLILNPEPDDLALVHSALPARAWEIHVAAMAAGASPRLPRTARTRVHRPPWVQANGGASRLAAMLGRPPTTAGSPAPDRPRPVRWLAELIDDLSPEVMYSPTLLPAVMLAVGASRAVKRRFPAWLSAVSGRDVTTELQDDDEAQRVADALAQLDGLLPRSEQVGRRAVELGFGGRLFDPLAVPLAIDLARIAPPRRPAELRRTILVDGRHDVADRAHVAIAGWARCAPDVAGHDVQVVNPTDYVAAAAELLATDTGLRVTVVRATRRRAILGAHSAARISIRLSLLGDVDWWDVAAMASGAVPVLSAVSLLGSTTDGQATAVLVDPDEPAAVAEAVRRLAADDELVRAAGTRNAAFARRHYAGDARAALRNAVTALVGER